MRRWVLIGAAALAALVTMTACSSSGNQSATSGTSSAGSSAAATSTPATGAHNQADVTFAQNMIPHHEQHCIQMSDIILRKQGIDPRVVQLANQIKAEQGPEIQQMRSWLSQWGQPTISMAPGMMSDQDMTALQNAQGVDASKQFLTGMIQEHQAAIAMAQDEIKSGQNQPAVALAHTIVTNHQQEITTMQGILASL
ncbi:MAG: hypothetical protein QOJ56_3427 [Mycobacterium sp.]|nr:hypothetical protein [Mycobacterium sp.]